MDLKLLKLYGIIFLGLFLCFSFVEASLNPFAWNWISRGLLILSFLALSVYLDYLSKKE
jgi:uncharacterized membrane protein AbrB (regulator of aidB expression)